MPCQAETSASSPPNVSLFDESETVSSVGKVYSRRRARSTCRPVIAPGLCSRGVSGANEQQRETGSRRGWWLVGLLAVSGAAIGAFAGHRLDPDVSELAPSLAVAGFGLRGLVGLFVFAPLSLWGAGRPRPDQRRAATPTPPQRLRGAGG